ncbi:MAG: PQQ-dependent sugar dehydrogenase [Thermodesulfobacteriota bacterium]
MNKIKSIIIFFLILLAPMITNTWAIQTQRVATGFSNPLFLTSPPDDFQRLFIVEQNSAQIKIIKNGTVLTTPFLDLNSKAGSGGEQGLLGLAFDPEYATNGFFYVNYTNNSGDTVLTRYTVSGNPDIADPGSEIVFATIDQPFGNHNGGMLAFSPNDGFLYYFLGDGGSGNDPGNRAQNSQNILGKIHRIDVNGGFTVPAENPFVGDPSTLDSIWSLGVRNPWRASFDRLNGDLYFGDVGQGQREEISWQPSVSGGGENYGWRCMEGNRCTGLSGCACNDPGLTLPLHDYTHASGNCSVTGGYVYRGSAIPSLDGTYFFADYCSGRIWSFKWNGSVLTEFQERTSELVPDIGSINNITSFGEDAAGELYIVDQDGEIFKIISDDEPAPITLSTLNPNISGIVNTIEARGATPNGDVTYLWGFIEGTASANQICPGLQSGISDFRNLVTVRADGNGLATHDVFVPQGFRGRSIVLQAVDITTCSGSNVTNQTLDSQQPIDIALNPFDPGRAGELNTLSVSGATPSGDVTFIWGFDQTTFPANNLCSGLEVDILNFRTLPTVTADSSGNAFFNITIPGGFSGRSVVLQAVDRSSCTKSNLVMETL